jgi:hypothetical protein
MICKECDMQNADGSVLCKYCGARLQTPKPADAPPEALGVTQPGKEDGKGKGLLRFFNKKQT